MTAVIRKTSIDEFRLTFVMRVLNRMDELLEGANIKLVKLGADDLIAQACRQTGLSDWGDAKFLRDYAVLLSSFEHNSALSLLGRLGMRREFLRVLTNRLYIQDSLKRQPAILNTPIPRPLFILGLPRTGTTLLHKMLAQDPNMRVPPLWQLLVPLPLTISNREIARRISSAERLTQLAYFVAPKLRSMHIIDAHEPEECVFLLPHHLVQHGRGHVPDYKAWYLSRSAVSDYQYYKQQLQCLQWQQPVKHWVMKSPFHLFTLDALLTVFPDACIVQTHRDLNKVLPSWCSFAAGIGIMHRKQVDRQQIGDEWLALWQLAIERMMSVRDAMNAAQCFDLQYDQFMADPIDGLRQIYQYFDYELTADTEATMRAWLKDNAQDKYGLHRYDAGQFGLSADRIRTAFKNYTVRYRVQPE
jgi:hypothetical protein